MPTMNKTSMGLSIKSAPKRDEVATGAVNRSSVASAAPQEDYIFNEKDINFYWQAYAAQLSKEQDALMKRMQLIRPTLLNDGVSFEVVGSV